MYRIVDVIHETMQQIYEALSIFMLLYVWGCSLGFGANQTDVYSTRGYQIISRAVATRAMLKVSIMITSAPLLWYRCKKKRMCNRWKDKHVSKKDHKNCNRTGPKTLISSWKHSLSKSKDAMNKSWISNVWIGFEHNYISFRRWAVMVKSNYIITLRNCFGMSMKALRHYFEKSLWIDWDEIRW